MNQFKCPKCSSTEVSKPKTSRRSIALSFLLLGFPLPFLEKESHCFDCGLDFKYKKKGDNEHIEK